MKDESRSNYELCGNNIWMNNINGQLMSSELQKKFSHYNPQVWPTLIQPEFIESPIFYDNFQFLNCKYFLK